ncbi:MAG: hypothetical protein ACO1G9_08165 [Bacteroidota bacterium]
MDRRELDKEIIYFINKCNEYGKPILEYCLNEAYPGASNTSYFFDIKATWVKDDECFEAISFFTDVMFEAMSLEARQRIFSIRVFSSEDQLHCDSGEIKLGTSRAS